MQKNVIHFHDKIKKRDRFYGSLKAIYEFKENVGISIYTLYKHDFDKPFDNYLCRITQGTLRVSSTRKRTNLEKAKRAKLFFDDSNSLQGS